MRVWLQGREEGHQVAVRMPVRRGLGHGIRFGDRACLQCLGLHLQVDLGVAIGGLKGDVPEPGADRIDVNAGTEEVYRRRVTTMSLAT